MKKYSLLLLVITLSVLISGCSLDKLKVGEVRMMYGTNEAGRISYEIRTFTGTESGDLEAAAGQWIAFTYAVELDKGTLFVAWQDPQGDVIWQKDFSESDQGEGEFEALSSGSYQVFIRGTGMGGRFDVSWEEK